MALISTTNFFLFSRLVMAPPVEIKRPDTDFQVDTEGGDGYRRLREEEKQELKVLLNNFSAEATRISPEEIEFKKGLNCVWFLKDVFL